MTVITAKSWGQNAGTPIVRLRCPFCRHQGTFEGPGSDVQAHGPGRSVHVGVRRCPNDTCHAVVFVATEAGKLLVSYPPEVLDFDSTNLPPPVLAALEEAIKCHAAECYMAAGMMVRKSMEEMCNDRKVDGKDLKAKIANLGTKAILPAELLTALDGLRLLGNDAAHVESQTYTQVGKQEVETAIAVAKAILQALYQYSALLTQLEALKK